MGNTSKSCIFFYYLCYNKDVIIMNSKGFTLIELIAVLAILGVVGVIVTISFTVGLHTTNQKGCDDFVKELEDAACVYAGLADKKVECNRNNCEPISVQLLVEKGLVKSTKDACTKGEIDVSATVTVSWDQNNEKHCEYNGVKKYER